MKKSQHPTEAQEQRAVISFWRMYAPYRGLDERLLMHTANERKTTPRQGAYLKAQGVRAGWPDLFLALPAADYHGLFIELKRIGGRTTKAQEEIHALLRARGYLVLVCYGYQQAVNDLMHYVGLALGEKADEQYLKG